MKSVARYVKSHPRVLLQYKYQEPPLGMDAIVDTDFAGSRKSTNGGYVMHGTHLIKSWVVAAVTCVLARTRVRLAALRCAVA